MKGTHTLVVLSALVGLLAGCDSGAGGTATQCNQTSECPAGATCISSTTGEALGSVSLPLGPDPDAWAGAAGEEDAGSSEDTWAGVETGPEDAQAGGGGSGSSGGEAGGGDGANDTDGTGGTGGTGGATGGNTVFSYKGRCVFPAGSPAGGGTGGGGATGGGGGGGGTSGGGSGAGACPTIGGTWTVTAHCVTSVVGTSYEVTQQPGGCSFDVSPGGWTGSVGPGGALTMTGDGGTETPWTCTGTTTGSSLSVTCTPQPCSVTMTR